MSALMQLYTEYVANYIERPGNKSARTIGTRILCQDFVDEHIDAAVHWVAIYIEKLWNSAITICYTRILTILGSHRCMSASMQLSNEYRTIYIEKSGNKSEITRSYTDTDHVRIP